MEKVIITGASGFLGRYLLSHEQDSYEIFGTKFNSEIENDTVESVTVDLTNPPFDSLQDRGADYVIHCAALTDVDECERNPEMAHRINVEMTEYVSEFASKTNADLLMLSTDAVFDGSRSWWSEEDPTNPINVYGETKRAAEKAAIRNHEEVTIVRTNFFGWTPDHKSSLAEWMLETLSAGDELTGFEDVFFTPLYAGDLAAHLFELLEIDCPEILHLSGSERLSKLEFAHRVADVFDYDDSLITPIQLSDIDLDAPRGNDLSLDSSKAENLIGETFPKVQTGLEKMKEEVKP